MIRSREYGSLFHLPRHWGIEDFGRFIIAFLIYSHRLIVTTLGETINAEKAKAKQSKAKQRCVMGVGMCLYAQLVQTKHNINMFRVIDIDYAHATLSTAHIMSMSSTKRPRIDWIIVSNAVLI